MLKSLTLRSRFIRRKFGTATAVLGWATDKRYSLGDKFRKLLSAQSKLE
ncbi:hypothetical protein [Sulfurirhabdus autotrophica]|nr:hypothetical protein [Sulfurirhabdus autotrophica]